MTIVSTCGTRVLPGPIAASAPAGGRMLTVDALRGAAALAVVVGHIILHHTAWQPGRFPWSIAGVLGLVGSFGFLGVWLFFVLSGFCIHLPWAVQFADGRHDLPAFTRFWRRRLWRLYPPYVAALAIYLALSWWAGTPASKPPWTYNLLMHLAMLHNFDTTTAYSIDIVLWSLAVEMQFYLLYFLLLPLRLRLGWRWTLLALLGVRYAWMAASLGAHRCGLDVPLEESALFTWSWWAAGALAAEAYLGIVRVPPWCRSAGLGGALLLLGCVWTQFNRLWPDVRALHWPYLAGIHVVWGGAFFALLMAAIRREAGDGFAPRGRTLLGSLAAVGVWSYSLYLLHDVTVVHLASWAAGWLGWPRTVLAWALLPVCLALCWAFFQACERHFLTAPGGRPRRTGA